jgi:hypothetical protein
MNEFVAKKLGEVLAFSRIGLECKERGGAAFSEALADMGERFSSELTDFASAIESRANEITTTKAEKTTEKLRGMMEAYIGDEWDNPTELLEWLSFFLGSAAAHWSLVRGAAEATSDSGLADVGERAIGFYKSGLEHVMIQLHSVGKTRAIS